MLTWLPDLGVWADVVAHFVRPGGFLYVTEAHPLFWVWDDDEGVIDLRLRYPYFSRPEPLATMNETGSSSLSKESRRCGKDCTSSLASCINS